MDAVGTGVGVFAASDDHEEVRFAKGNLFLFFVVFTNEAHQFFEVPRTIIYLCAAQFAFDEGVAAVFQVQDNVGLQAVAVTVVRDLAVARGGIDLKVADTACYCQDEPTSTLFTFWPEAVAPRFDFSATGRTGMASHSCSP